MIFRLILLAEELETNNLFGTTHSIPKLLLRFFLLTLWVSFVHRLKTTIVLEYGCIHYPS